MYRQRNEVLKWLVLGVAILGLGWFIWQGGKSKEVDWVNLPAEEVEGAKVSEDSVSTGKGVEAVGRDEGVKDEKIVIHVAGAVKKPGVYFLEPGARVVDVVQAAEGVTGTADLNNINLAQVLSDGQKVLIPDRVNPGLSGGITGGSISAPGAGASSGSGSGSSGGVVNLNTASSTELMTLPGIGSSKAAAIISYREEKGRFAKVEDLMNVSGIGEKTFAKLKSLITVN